MGMTQSKSLGHITESAPSGEQFGVWELALNVGFRSLVRPHSHTRIHTTRWLSMFCFVDYTGAVINVASLDKSVNRHILERIIR